MPSGADCDGIRIIGPCTSQGTVPWTTTTGAVGRSCKALASGDAGCWNAPMGSTVATTIVAIAVRVSYSFIRLLPCVAFSASAASS